MVGPRSNRAAGLKEGAIAACFDMDDSSANGSAFSLARVFGHGTPIRVLTLSQRWDGTPLLGDLPKLRNKFGHSIRYEWRSLGDSNPRFRRERATSWAARRREPKRLRDSPERAAAQAFRWRNSAPSFPKIPPREAPCGRNRVVLRPPVRTLVSGVTTDNCRYRHLRIFENFETPSPRPPLIETAASAIVKHLSQCPVKYRVARQKQFHDQLLLSARNCIGHH